MNFNVVLSSDILASNAEVGYKIIGVDEIIQYLDDHLVAIQAMMATRFVEEIKEIVQEW